MNKSTFTGESALINASVDCTNDANPLESGNMVFCGSIVEQGDGKGVVCFTG